MGADYQPTLARGVRWNDPRFAIAWPVAAGRHQRPRRRLPRLQAMNCILVTGASGYAGRQCLGHLQELGFEVHGIARQPLPSAGVVMHAADLLQGTDWRPLLNELRPTHLLHLAWTTAHGAFWTDPANDAWLETSRRLVGLPSSRRAGGE